MYPFKEIERKWTKKWQDSGIYEPDLSASRRTAKKPFYNLMMFPYPSAEGLHVGNVYAFTGSDVYGRFQRMQGKDVFEPIGLDGFGIHSENYALKTKTHPMKQSKVTEKNFYRQLQMIGNGFAWNERLETYDPDYYKWTQWIFLQMYKNGLAYRKKASVNWCPSCKTVLADEQVINGECERCGTKVTKKDLEQWFFKITKYADKLLKNMDKIDWPERIKTAQRNWIGRSEGAEIEFGIKNHKSKIKVFTTRPDTIFGATYMVLAPEHELVEELKGKITNWNTVSKYVKQAKEKTDNERIIDAKSKTGVELKGIMAINPTTKKEISIWIADYVLGGVGTGAIMAVPAHDERDWEFARRYQLSVTHVIKPKSDEDLKTWIYPQFAPTVLEGGSVYDAGRRWLLQEKKLLREGKRCYSGEGIMINSGKFDGMDSEKAKWEITKYVSGKKKKNYHLRDWLISRQRYWGPPIPIIYCDECGAQPVPEKDLPVLLPNVKDFQPRGKGESPLATSESFYKIKCPVCEGPARRETDVSDTFLDSAWYFMRYPDVNNKKQPFDKQRAKKWLPVDMYIGGAEHAVLHLLYARFLAMAMKDMKLVDFEEPFTAFRSHGLLIKEGAKMSKSKDNIVNPDEYVRKFGADTLRTYLMFLGPLQDGGDWRDAGIMGAVRFLSRVWKFGDSQKVGDSNNISNWMHAPIKKISEDIPGLKYNTAIAELMKVLNRFEKEGAGRKDFEAFLLMLAPFAPFIAEELWEKLGNKYSIHEQAWPKYDKKYLIEDTVNLIVQVNGKVRATIKVKRGITQKDAEKLALAEDSVTRHVKGKPKKVIFVKDKLVNFVV